MKKEPRYTLHVEGITIDALLALDEAIMDIGFPAGFGDKIHAVVRKHWKHHQIWRKQNVSRPVLKTERTVT